jgi:predicted glutamine amidotransferase
MKPSLFGFYNTWTIAFSSLQLRLLLLPNPLSGFVDHDFRECCSPSHSSAHEHSLLYGTSTSLGCQLLGMNCNTPTDFTFSLKGFCKRGGDTDIHSDGWGVAFYEQHGIRQFHDVEAAASSPMANFLSSHPIRTLNMMAHIRFATVGNVQLSNVHPFCREMWGVNFAFAMNGDVPMFKQDPHAKLNSLGPGDSPCKEEIYYNPVGSTDSEAAFCAILNALRVRFQRLPSLPVLYDALQQLCDEIISNDLEGTIMNFLLTCGPNTLWVYSWPGQRPGSKTWNGLHYTTREFPFSSTHLCDMDYSVDFSTRTTEDDCVSVIATKPLTDDEEWVELQRGELIVFDQGRPNISHESLFEIELLGRGLQSTVLEKPVLEEDMRIYNIDPSCFLGSCI